MILFTVLYIKSDFSQGVINYINNYERIIPTLDVQTVQWKCSLYPFSLQKLLPQSLKELNLLRHTKKKLYVMKYVITL